MLVPELSVTANLMLGRERVANGLLDDDAMEAEARRLLEEFGVAGDIDATQAVGLLGIGLQQVVEIVRALSQQAQILILDEPTAALTKQESDRLMIWLRELRAGGTTCIYVTHRMDEVFALCDRATILRDGKTVGTVVVRDSSADEIVSMMVGRSLAKGQRAKDTVRDGVALALRDIKVAIEERALGRGEMRFAVDGVSLECKRGEVVAVCGAMGSGRTALLSTVFGCARRGFTGAVSVGGRDVALDGPAAAIAEGIALIPEDRKGRGLVLGMTVSENLALVPERSRVARFFEWLGFVDEDAEELVAEKRIDELQIRGAASAEVGTLSGGNQQKVVLGKWLEDPPRVLLLDEPTRGVDVGAREEIYGLVEKLTAKGAAVLLASSDLPEVLRLAHRIVVLRQGRIVAELDGRSATEEEIVALATGASRPSPAGAEQREPYRAETACVA
jgi:ABC-type sugar transport system ATPase subunit